MDGQLIQRWMKSCRLCLLDDGVKLPIFGEEGIVREVAHKIQSCFPIVLYNTDPLSKIICQRCLFMLDTVYSFRQKCVETNEVFTSHLKSLKSNSSSVKQYLQALEKSGTPVASPTTQISPRPTVRSNDRRSTPPVGRPPSFRSESDPLANSEEYIPPPLVRIKQEPGTKSPAKSVPKIVSVVGSYSDNVIAGSSLSQTAPPSPLAAPSPFAAPSPVAAPSPFAVPSRFAVPHAVKIKQEYGALRARAKRNFKLLTPWHCKFCKKYYKTKGTLYKHRKYFCPFKTLSCGKCSQVFINESERIQHWATHLRVHVHLKEEELHPCPICHRRFAYKAILRNHLKIHEGDNDQYTLHTDDSQSGESVSHQPQSVVVPRKFYRRRFRGGTGERFNCNLCPSSYGRKAKLNYHKKHFHRAEWLAANQKLAVVTPVSEEAEPSPEDPSVSAPNPSVQKYRPAPLSKQKFKKDSQGLLRQLLSKPKCEICFKVFTNRSGLTNHMRSHTPKNPHRCVVCGRLFGSKKGLLYHEKAKHGGFTAPRDAYRCRACNRSFKTRSEWLLHTLTHDKTRKEPKTTDDTSLASTKLLLCSYCNEVFSETAAYKLHMQTHKVTNPSLVHTSASAPDMQATSWSCHLCSKVFSIKRNLKRHQAAHAARMYSSHPCDVCDKLFLSRASLLRHMPVHSTPSLSKTFHCSLCYKIFFKIEALQNHMCTPGGPGITGNPENPFKDQLDLPLQGDSPQSEPCKDQPYGGKPFADSPLDGGDFAGLTFQKAPQNCNFCGYARLNGHKCLYRKDSNAPLSYSAKKVMSKALNRYGTYKCRLCAATFPSSYSHNSHMKVHKRGGKHHRPILKVPMVVDRAAVPQMVGFVPMGMLLADNEKGAEFTADVTAPLDLRCTLPTETGSAESEPVAMQVAATEPLFPVTALYAAAQVGDGGSEPGYLPETPVQAPAINNDVFFDENEFYQCILCTKTFHSEQGLASHVKSHETPAENPFQCQFCPQTYPDSQAVDQHILLNHPELSGLNC